MPTPTTNIVIDISHHNPVTDFEKVFLSGIRGVIHKATQGLTGEDSQYAARVHPIRSSGLMHGAYHFGTNADGVAQAKHFLGVVKPDARTLLALDIERNPAGGTMTMAQARQFVTYIHNQTGRWPLLYSGASFLLEHLGDTVDPVLSKCPLWVARYGPPPQVQKSWPMWTLWQYTEQGTIPGIKGNVDRNYFAGNLNVLRKVWNYPSLV